MSSDANHDQPVDLAMGEQVHDPRDSLAHFRDPVKLIFPEHLTLLPQVNEVYELRLAYMESLALTDEELIQRGAYFAKVNDTYTNHFLLCSGEPLQLSKSSSIRLRAFFEANQFKTGYATHGLFPYRGKFHPQMIRALLNIMRLQPQEDTVLDPMMGSGTVMIEAALMGIDSMGIDISPFCVLMARAKVGGLVAPAHLLREYVSQADEVFNLFESHRTDGGLPRSKPHQASFDDVLESESHSTITASFDPPSDGLRDILELAYLDSLAYAQRRKKASPRQLFGDILAKYVRAIQGVQKVIKDTELSLGRAGVGCGDARKLHLADESIDGVIFSPPYSFSIDYIKIDTTQLEYLGSDIQALRENLVGLRGGPKEKVRAYFEDMRLIMEEVARVLKPRGFCTIVVGSNTKQLARILGKPEDQVRGIEDRLVDFGQDAGLTPVERITRQITGIRNIMRNEWILIFQRE